MECEQASLACGHSQRQSEGMLTLDAVRATLRIHSRLCAHVPLGICTMTATAITLQPMRKSPSLMLATVAAAGAFAAPGPRIEDFFAANAPREDLLCSFTTTATSTEYPGEIRVERFTPPDHWELLTVNGEPPSADALGDYAEDAEERLSQRRSPEEMDFASMIQPKTATVQDEDADTVVFAFTPRVQSRGEGGGRDLGEKMRGTLTVLKDGLRPLRLHIENTEPISPAPTFKFTVFRQDMTFAFDPAVGASFVKSMEFAMSGKALVFKKMNTETRIAFDDLDCRSAKPDAKGRSESEVP